MNEPPVLRQLAMDGECDKLSKLLKSIKTSLEGSLDGDRGEAEDETSTIMTTKLRKKLREHVDTVDSFGRSALFYACIQNDVPMTELLFSYHADPNLIDEDGYSPLFIPCQNGFDKIVELLIQHGADVNQTVGNDDDDCCDGGCVESPLLAAIFEEHVNVVKLLLKHKADVNVITETYAGHKTALQVAEQLVQNREIVDLLFAHGAMYTVSCATAVPLPTNDANAAQNAANERLPIWMRQFSNM